MQVNDANRRRRHIGVLAVACFVGQLVLAPGMALGNGRPNLAFVFATSVALSVGGRVGVLCAFFAGLVFDLSTTGPIGLMALLLTALSYPLGIEQRDRMSEEPVRSLAVASVASLSVSLAYHLMMLLVGQASSIVDAIVLRSLPTALLTIVCYLPVAVALGRDGTGGGIGSISGGKRGGHYSLGRS